MRLSVFTHVTTTSTFLTFLCIIAENQLTTALRDVSVKVPHAVRRGEKAVLKCFYDIEDDTLYSVKWYKGRREFYRYTPKETPAMKLFQFPGVKVERTASNESQLVLDSVNMATTGKYSCEVSADAPSFHTLISAGELEVVEVPGKDPIIAGIRSRYRVGDIVRGNCTSRHSKPAANLTWTINGYDTNPSHIRHHKPLKDAHEMETSISSIHFVVTPQHFIYGKLKIRCTAHIHDVYWKSTEKSIEEERHKHTGSGNSINLVNTFSEDDFDVDEESLHDRSDTYMTNIKGDVSSLASSATKATLISLMPLAIAMMLLLNALQQFMQLFIQHLLDKCYCSSNTNTNTNANNENKELHRNKMKCNINNKNSNCNTHNCNSSCTCENIASGKHISVAATVAVQREITTTTTKDKNAIKTTAKGQQKLNLLTIKKTNSNQNNENRITNNSKNLFSVQRQRRQQQLFRKLTMTTNSVAEAKTTTAAATKEITKSCYSNILTSIS